MKEIILHLGFHKTASTSIQQTLYKNCNKAVFCNKGYIYPDELPSNHGIVFYSMFSPHPEKYSINIRKGLSLEEIHKNHESWKNYLIKLSGNNTNKKLILSGEGISLLSKYSLSKFRDFVINIFKTQNIRVIIYVRNPYDFIRSNYGEYQKTGINKDISSIKPNYELRFERIFSTFDENNIKIYKFEDAIKNSFGPVGHFYEKVLRFSDKEIKSFKLIRSNESYSQLALELCKHINSRGSLVNDSLKLNTNRTAYDLFPIIKIDGSKFKLNKEESDIASNNSIKEIDNLLRYNIVYNIEKNDKVSFITTNSIQSLKKVYPRFPLFLRSNIMDYFCRKDLYSYPEFSQIKSSYIKETIKFFNTVNKKAFICKSDDDFCLTMILKKNEIIVDYKKNELYFLFYFLCKELGHYQLSLLFLKNMFIMKKLY